MTTTKATKPARHSRLRVEARCGKPIKRRLDQAKRSTGYGEADFLLTALEEFFANHRTPAKQIAAVQRSRQAMAAAAKERKEAA